MIINGSIQNGVQRPLDVLRRGKLADKTQMSDSAFFGALRRSRRRKSGRSGRCSKQEYEKQDNRWKGADGQKSAPLGSPLHPPISTQNRDNCEESR